MKMCRFNSLNTAGSVFSEIVVVYESSDGGGGGGGGGGGVSGVIV